MASRVPWADSFAAPIGAMALLAGVLQIPTPATAEERSNPRIEVRSSTEGGAERLPRSAARSKGCDVTRHQTRLGVWTTIQLPEWPERGSLQHGSSAVFAVDHRSPNRLLVSDGWAVFRTKDGGCSWKQVFGAADTPTDQWRVNSHTGLVKEVILPQAGATGRAYMFLEQDGLPLLGRSDDGGQTWSVGPLRLKADPAEGTEGMIVGEPDRLWVAPNDARILYATVRSHTRGLYQNVQPDAGLLRSYDAGATWQVSSVYSLAFDNSAGTSCSLGADRCTGVPWATMAVDPLEPEVLWTSSKDGIYRSQDAGITWERASNIGQSAIYQIHDIDIWHRRGRPARIVALGQLFIAWSEDGGGSWQNVKVPDKSGFARDGSAAFGAAKDGYVAELQPSKTGRQDVFWLWKGSWAEVTPTELKREECAWPSCELSGTDAIPGKLPRYFFMKEAGSHPEQILLFAPKHDRRRRNG